MMGHAVLSANSQIEGKVEEWVCCDSKGWNLMQSMKEGQSPSPSEEQPHALVHAGGYLAEKKLVVLFRPRTSNVSLQ